ncbi:hypothetical protein Btru_062491 [Bulinus truncatus]|nr:hypothetical protein Btru_062491 [Bulinus truncatus]
MNLMHRIPNDPSRGGGLNNLRSTLSISRSVSCLLKNSTTTHPPIMRHSVQSSKAPTVVSVDTSVLADLFEAIGEGKTEAVKNILATYYEPSLLLKRKDPQGLTPLKKAVALNKAEIVRILVSYGAAPSVRDPAGRTALHTAVMQGRRELIAPLLVSKDSCVNVQDSHGSTPLHFAVRGKHLKAINWLLYAGADINLRDKDDKTALDYCDEDSPVRAMLSKYEHSLDDGPLDLCCAFIGRKQLNQIGPDGLLMFVTSAVWSERMQFIFCIRIRPYRATPPIPLRLDEQYYSDVWHYRMMRRLAPRETRVKAYFRLFEELSDWEIVLKITSKRKYLGELPVSLSRYTQYALCTTIHLPAFVFIYEDIYESGYIDKPKQTDRHVSNSATQIIKDYVINLSSNLFTDLLSSTTASVQIYLLTSCPPQQPRTGQLTNSGHTCPAYRILRGTGQQNKKMTADCSGGVGS